MHFSLYGEPKSRLRKKLGSNEERGNATSANREYRKVPAKVHLTMSNKNAMGVGLSDAIASPHRRGKGKISTQKGRSAHYFEEISYSNKIAVV
jgi:hypothetical protein